MRQILPVVALLLGLMPMGCATVQCDSKCTGPAVKVEPKAKTLLAWQAGPDDDHEAKKDKPENGKGKEDEKDNEKNNDEAKPPSIVLAKIQKVDEPGAAGDAPADAAGGEADEPDTIVTDRPDFTEASSTVGKGRIQLEGGYTFSRNREMGVTEDHSYPELLLRVGLFADWFELRVGQNFTSARGFVPGGGPFNISGGDDLYVGFKLGLTEQKKCLPETVLVIQSQVPTGPRGFTAGRMLPGMNYLYGWDVNDFISVAGSSQGNIAVDDDGHSFLLLAQSLTVGYTLTERLGAYTEVFGVMPDGAIAAGIGPEYYFNGGLTYKFTPNLQYDVRGGVGLNRQSADYFVGSGFAVRY